jgi:uncharacterized membrane protein SpoIIM required for sporulation/ABC-type transport system involved in multi-copper enzyme maturation permease subunit
VNTHTITTITRREVRETLSDWRIVLPIALLTFLLPQLLVIAARQVINVATENSDLATRLLPFAALLVGFVPASFSLITALESFVGERERNTLESLLAMPISDRDLYVSKLISSLATPLVSSFIAITIFNLLLALFEPALYPTAFSPLRLLLIFLLVGSMALVMVAGAVVISSQINSIKAANLMSSFILLPMVLIVQFAAFAVINDRWAELWLIAGGLAFVAGLLVRAGLLSFNREEILSREQRQGSLDGLLSALRARLGRAPASATTQHPTPNTQHPTPAFHPVLVVLARELRDTSTDWRVLAPIFVLTCVVPLALVGGVGYAIGFVGEPGAIARLLPFAGLLMAFVPASFSLIGALESFVGERERNTLESLLAMPISDRGLYTGKLIAALIVPLLASLAAMIVFLAFVGALYPQLYYLVMTPLRLFGLMAFVAVITLMMVAGAVVISSHTSSIRAATLLASFVLVPTAVLLQLSALLFIANRWDVVRLLGMALAVIAIALIRSGLSSFQREEILSREHDQLSLGAVGRTFRGFFREYRPAGVPPQSYAGLKFSAGRYYRHELPALLRELRLPIGVAAIAALSGLLGGSYVGKIYDLSAFAPLVDAVGSAPPPSPLLALSIFFNNLRVSLLSNLFGAFSFGIFAFLVPAVAFAQIGFVSSTLAERGGSWLALGPASPLTFVLAYVLPHGIIELPTFILSAAFGLRMGASLLALPAGFNVAENFLWATANFLKTWLLLIAPLVLLGALIEGLVTPLIIAALY